MRLKAFDNLLASYFCWTAVLYPVLTMYSFIHIKLEYIAVVIGIFLFCIKSYNKSVPFVSDKSVILFFAYMIIWPSLIFLLFICPEASLFQTGTIFFFCVLSLITVTGESGLLWRYYFVIFWIALVVFFIQEILWYSIGIRFSALIPGLDFSFYGEGGGAQMAEFQKTSNRSCSIFMEPAIFAKFLIPAVVYNLKYTRKSCVRLLGLVGVFLLLRSGVGFFLLATCLCIYIFKLPIRHKSIKIFTIVGIIGIILGSVFVLSTTEYGASQLARMDEFDSEDGNTSGFQRIIRGYLLFDGMNTFEKVFGVGSKNIGRVIAESPYVFFFDSTEDIYLNGVQAILVGGGVVGLMLFAVMIRGIGNRKSVVNIGILSCLLVSFFIAAEYLSATMLLFLSIVILEKKKYQQSVKIQNGLQNLSR